MILTTQARINPMGIPSIRYDLCVSFASCFERLLAVCFMHIVLILNGYWLYTSCLCFDSSSMTLKY